jgi:hypothetical protein
MRWRVRAALRGQLALGDQVRAAARDEVSRDHWVVTDQEVIRIKGRTVAQRMSLADAVVAISTQPSAGITIRIHSRRNGENRMLTSFRKPNAVTRRLAELSESRGDG